MIKAESGEWELGSIFMYPLFLLFGEPWICSAVWKPCLRPNASYSFILCWRGKRSFSYYLYSFIFVSCPNRQSEKTAGVPPREGWSFSLVPFLTDPSPDVLILFLLSSLSSSCSKFPVAWLFNDHVIHRFAPVKASGCAAAGHHLCAGDGSVRHTLRTFSITWHERNYLACLLGTCNIHSELFQVQ